MIRKIFIIIVFTSAVCSAGWKKLNSNTSEWLTDVCFLNELTGFAVGYNGIILKTTDGGNNWTATTVGNGETFASVFFVNSNKGFAVGTNAIIASTADGGVTWTYKNLSYEVNLNEIYFTDEMHGWIAAGVSESKGAILKTTDGGINWEYNFTATSTNLSGVKFRANNHGYAVGRNGWFYRTTDGGFSWSAKNISINVLQDIALAGSDLWATGDHGQLMKSTDDGLNWTIISTQSDDHLFKASFIDSTFGWIVGGYGSGYQSLSSTILNTEDGGQNWDLVQNPAWQKLYSVAPVTKNLAFAVGYNGTILRFDRGIPSMKLLSPAGGESWAGGSSHNIQWLSAGVESVNIYYSSNGGVLWNTVAQNISAASGNYLWLVPNVVSSDCRVKITDTNNSAVKDSSQSSFSIYKDIKVIGPDGGENWISGTIQNIRWTKQSVGNVKLEYTTDNGSNWVTIVNSISSTEENYLWQIPNLTSYLCKIRVSDVSNPQINDESDNVFAILYQPYVVVTSPVEGDYWKAGTVHKIGWNSFNANVLKIEYSADNGVSWQNVIGNISADIGSYYWTLPEISSTNCKVKISVVESPNVSAVNEGVFTIYQPLLLLINPDSGEILVSDMPSDIVWSQVYVRKVKLEYSTDNGDSWKLIADSIDASKGSYSWKPPYVSSTKCKVRISDSFDKDVFDESDGVFTITKPAVKLISPNGGEQLKVGEIKSIEWSSNYVDNVKLEYSTDAGSTWIVIVNSLSANPQNYSWLVPNVNSDQCKIRISDINKMGITDESDQVFKISTTVGVNGDAAVPAAYGLDQNYPNPFNPATVIEYRLPEPGYVSLNVYDILGKLVVTLVDEYKSAGFYKASFDINRRSGLKISTSGIYFYILKVNEYSQSKKMILMK